MKYSTWNIVNYDKNEKKLCIKRERLEKVVEEVCNSLMKLQVEVNTLVEEKVMKIREYLQGFHAMIVDLEVCTILRTSLEEREQRVKTTTKLV